MPISPLSAIAASIAAWTARLAEAWTMLVCPLVRGEALGRTIWLSRAAPPSYRTIARTIRPIQRQAGLSRGIDHDGVQMLGPSDPSGMRRSDMAHPETTQAPGQASGQPAATIPSPF